VLLGECSFPCRGQSIVTATPLSALLHPATLDPSSVLHAVQNWVESRKWILQFASGSGLDNLTDLISVARFVLENRQYD
jgi:hypothetical protein